MFRIDSRVARACGLAAALVALAWRAPLVAGTAEPHLLRNAPQEAREPFGRGTWVPSGGGLLEKWLAVWRRWKDEKRALDACRDDRPQCADPAARKLLAIIDTARALRGRAQLGEINRAINLAIKPVDDLKAHGKTDVWSSPLETLASRAGDCEDYAIAKFAALLEAGVPAENLRLMVVRDSARSDDHAVVAAKLDDAWLVLDNRRLVMLTDMQLANYSPLLQLDGEGARRYAGASPVATDGLRAEQLKPGTVTR